MQMKLIFTTNSLHLASFWSSEMAYCKLLFESPGCIQVFLRACKIDDKKVSQNKPYSSSDQYTFWMYSFLKLLNVVKKSNLFKYKIGGLISGGWQGGGGWGWLNLMSWQLIFHAFLKSHLPKIFVEHQSVGFISKLGSKLNLKRCVAIWPFISKHVNCELDVTGQN